MAVHFIHIGKTGGTAVKHALRPLFKAGHVTPLGPILIHKGHKFRLQDVPPGDHAIFCVRDPISLFVSAFHSRKRKGQPKFYFEWSEAEAEAFERFPTPKELALALASEDAERRAQADAAMKAIQHVRGIRRALGSPREVLSRRDQIAYIGRQETLDDDFDRIRALLELSEDVRLPADPKKAHRRPAAEEPELDDAAIAALRRYYKREYEILDVCEKLRAEHGWNGQPPQRRSRWSVLLGR